MTRGPVQPKPIKHAKGEITRQAILEAAEKVFADMGFAAARLEDVAQSVGIRRPSIVYYFTNKQELFDAVEDNIFKSLGRHVHDKSEKLTDPWERLLALLDGWLDFMVARPTAAKFIQRNVADVSPRASDPTQFSETVVADMERMIVEGQDKGAFAPVRPIHAINALGSSILYYVCNANQYGRERAYDAADPRELAAYRRLLHIMARALLKPAPDA